jgi:hypothetical protein
VTRILIDSSAWIHFFNQSSRWHYESVAKTIREDQGVTCGLIITEVLRGARNNKEQTILSDHFELLEYLPLTKEDHLTAAAKGFQLARKGVTVKTIDLLIAHLAIENKLTLLHDDSDFEMIAKYFDLRTLV